MLPLEPITIALLFGSLVLLIGLLLVFKLNPDRQKEQEVLHVLFEQQDEAWVIFDGMGLHALKASRKAMEILGIEKEEDLGSLFFDSVFKESLEADELEILLKSIARNPFKDRALEMRNLKGENFSVIADIKRVQRGHLYFSFKLVEAFAGTPVQPEPARNPAPIYDLQDVSTPVDTGLSGSNQAGDPVADSRQLQDSIHPITGTDSLPSKPAEAELAKAADPVGQEPKVRVENPFIKSQVVENQLENTVSRETVIRRPAKSIQRPAGAAEKITVPAENPVSDAACIVSCDGRFVELSEAFSVLMGYSIEELRHLTFVHLLHPAESQAHDRWFSLLCGDKYRVLRCRRRFLHRDGRTLIVELIGAGMPSHRFVVITASDYSEVNRREQELQHSRENLLALVENTGEAVFALDGLGNFTVLNYRYRQIFEQQYGQVLREDLPYEQQLPPVDRKTWKEHFRAVTEGKTLQYRETIRFGSEPDLVLEVELYPVHDEAGLITGVTYSGRDITERIGQEQAILQARDKAEEATRAKSEFLALMSHEIRTPLNGLLGISELLNSTELNARQKEFVDIIRLSGEALLQVINDVLDFSKIEANKMQLENAPFSLLDPVNETIHILSGKASEKGLSLKVEQQAGLPLNVLGDKVRLRQVLLNLVGNALKFTERGGVTVFVRKSGELQGEVVLEFEVKDTGVGIDLEQARGLFNAFEQADPSTYRKYGGTGLGLTICKTIVSLMGGKIWVESQPGEGSSFFFTIRVQPAISGAPAASVLPTQSLPESGSVMMSEQIPLRILLAEDNDINRLLAVKLLERLGYSVVAAANGKEAYDRLKQQDFDLVLMDVQMPEWDGLEATRHIRSDIPQSRQPVIIAMTAFAGKEDRDACTSAGMDDYISKPITTNDLENALRKWAGKKSLSGTISARTGTEEVESTPRVDQDAVQRLMGIAGQTDPGFVQQLMEMFRRQAPATIQEIRTAIENGDLDATWKAAHKLKGTCLNMGASRLAGICKRIEQKAKSLDASGLSGLCLKMESEYRDTVEELSGLFQYN